MVGHRRVGWSGLIKSLLNQGRAIQVEQVGWSRFVRAAYREACWLCVNIDSHLLNVRGKTEKGMISFLGFGICWKDYWNQRHGLEISFRCSHYIVVGFGQPFRWGWGKHVSRYKGKWGKDSYANSVE